VLLAAANVYTCLKVSFIDGLAIPAALLAFGLFASRKGYGALENNITTTVASSAAVMSFLTGVVGPLPALALLGLPTPKVGIALLAVATGIMGVFIAALLRRRLVVEEALPFPTGMATGQVIETIFSARDTAMRRVRLLVIAAAVAGAITWFRDGRPAFIPQAWMFGGTLGGIAAATLGLGLAIDPLLLGVGAMIGVRTAAGIVLGASAARVVLGPWLVQRALVPTAEPGSLNSWLIWPALGLLLAGSFLPLLFDGGSIVRAFRELTSFGRARSDAPRASDDNLAPRAWALLLLASVAIVFLSGRFAFGVAPIVILIALALALLFANPAARATGETDVGPAGPLGTLGVIATVNRGLTSGMFGGWVGLGMLSQIAQTLWAFRAGHVLGASPRAQIRAQLLGVLIGAVVTVPVYFVVASSYGIGNEKMPAVGGLSWKATAEAMHGLSSLPRLGGTALLIGLGMGCVLTLLGRARIGRFLPSAAAIGIGFMLPFSAALAVLVGALLAAGAMKLLRGLEETSLMAVAAGSIAGESVVGVVIAALMAIGVL